MLSLSLIIFVLASNSLVADAGRPDQEVVSTIVIFFISVVKKNS
jgi:hypothetical protein